MSSELENDLSTILEALEQNPLSPELELLTFLNEQVLREQQIYWQRFAGFAAVHAGMLVVATSSVVAAPLVVSLLGLILAVAWAYIQLVSLWYTDRPKPLYHEMCKRLGIKFQRPLPEGMLGFDLPALARVLSNKRFSSTDVGLVVPVAVLFVWVLVLGGVFNHSIPSEPSAPGIETTDVKMPSSVAGFAGASGRV